MTLLIVGSLGGYTDSLCASASAVGIHFELATDSPISPKDGLYQVDFDLPLWWKTLQSLPQSSQWSGVLTASERLVDGVAYLANALGLPSAIEVPTLVRDKWVMHEALSTAGLRQARTTLVDSPEGIAAVVAAWSMVVIKPRDLAGSIGVFSVDSATDIEAAWNECVASSRIWNSENRGIIAQEFLPGTEYSVESVVEDGSVTTISVSGKSRYTDGSMVDAGLVVPAAVDNDLRESLGLEAKRAAEALGIKWGIAHTELIAGPAGPTVLEVAARIPGGQLVDLIDLAHGTNLYESAVLLAVGRPAPRSASPIERCAATWFIRPSTDGWLLDWKLPENVPDGYSIVLKRAVGDRVFAGRDSRARVGYVIGSGDGPHVVERVKGLAQQVTLRVGVQPN